VGLELASGGCRITGLRAPSPAVPVVSAGSDVLYT
jgi:hypothetical protein